MNPQWCCAAQVWYIKDTGVRLTKIGTVPGRGWDDKWKYALNIGTNWLEYVPDELQDLPFEELQTWVATLWRMK